MTPLRPADAVGAVLAGGGSRRYGRPKWREEVGGEAMAARALRALEPSVSASLVVGSDPGLAALGVPVRPDVRPGRGPVAGLETALLWAVEREAGHLLVLACDLPLVGPETAGAVAAAVRPGDEAVVPRSAQGAQPLCAAYSVGVLSAVRRLLDDGEASLRRLLTLVRVRWLEAAALPGGLDALTNVNDPEVRARAERLLLRRGTLPRPGGGGAEPPGPR